MLFLPVFVLVSSSVIMSLLNLCILVYFFFIFFFLFKQNTAYEMPISDWSPDVCSSDLYRRYLPDSFVPTQRSWGFENRSVALRVPAGSGDARRIEHRVAGADANPYLALATLLAGIHKGIVGEIEPGAPSDGNAALDYADGLPFRPPRAIAK